VLHTFVVFLWYFVLLLHSKITRTKTTNRNNKGHESVVADIDLRRHERRNARLAGGVDVGIANDDVRRRVAAR
jgi:hypothetical protein